ncbi:ABC transporter substrate-binding protein [Nibribacter ruber]|uniref:ABC transporter substrate-binding protein n=1 Tax=Nibribacter ruber TaxID=2698458 RepID=A0A6P1NZS7_9BACT|nr:ABC transporter substrate-binding protein [Nibribacter ruber]QHL86112.1 ABC transporter substrate-binding protein [Nibribacter ruber]
MKKRLVLAAMFLTLGWQVQAQNNAEQTTRFNNGRFLVDQQKYALAMEELLPLTSISASSQYAPDAAFLYSVAAAKEKKWKEAEQMLTQLQMQFPNWSGLPDAQYLLAQVQFEKKEYLKALQTLAPLQTTGLQQDAASMKRHYLLQLSDKTTFQYLVRQLPDDAVLGRAYADKLVSGWYTAQDKQQLEDLVRKFNLDRSYLTRTASLKKDEYNFAVLLPFHVTDQGIRVDKKNLFITDFYAGMQAARDTLMRQGIKVNLYPYDTGNDTAQVSQVLQLPEVGNMDALIGPIYKTSSQYAGKIAQQRGLNLINPFSDDLEMTKGNPYMFLLETSVATQGQRAAAFAYQNFAKKTAVVIYDSNKEDTTFAGNFKRAYTALGGKVQTFQKINSKTSGSVSGILGGVNLKDVGVLVVQSAAANVASSTVSLLEQRASKVPLVVPASWLEMSQISFSQLDFLEAYFLAPKFVDLDDPSVKAFRKYYTRQYNLPPSAFTYSGFELVYYLGQQLNSQGYAAPLRVSGLQPSLFYQGMNYQTLQGKPAQDNQYLPILKIDNGRVLIVNPVL